jgi:hypothetical protein
MFSHGSSCEDFIEAGVEMAVQGIRMIEANFPEGATPAMMRKFMDIVLKAMEQQAELYRLEGVPADWILVFQVAYVSTQREYFVAMKRATRVEVPHHG